MKKTVIINKTPPSLVNYKKALGTLENIKLLTKDTYTNAFVEFDEVVGYKEIETNNSYLLDILNNSQEIKRIIAINEFDLENAGKLRDLLKLHGQGKKSAKAFRDKVFMKELVKDVVKTPKFKRINNILDIYEFTRENGYPVVVKPIDGAASMNVHIIKSEDELKHFCSKKITEQLEVEEFIDGDMYHIDGLYQKGSKFLSIPSKYINKPLAHLENKFIGSYILNTHDKLYKELNNTVKNILDALPTPDHYIAFHAELFVTKEKEIYFCEIASRVGGLKIVETIEYATGINLLNEWIKAQADIEIDMDPKKSKQYGWLMVPPHNGSIIEADYSNPPEFVKEITSKENLIGTQFKNAESSIDFIVQLVVEGKTAEEVEENILLANEWITKQTIWMKEI